MENTSPNDPAEELVSLLKNKKINDPNSAEEKIVLPDECGDTLWDEVIEENENALPVKNTVKNEDVANIENDQKDK